jgi:hypothetical protein
MKMLSEYLEHALTFERMAADETDRTLKAQFQSQADAYRKLAAERAKQYGMPMPSEPESRHLSPTWAARQAVEEYVKSQRETIMKPRPLT